MSLHTLKPMLVQYLVGLCCLKWTPDAIDVTLGDMVNDSSAEEDRDVDVTVTVGGLRSPTQAFMAYEVKREKPPLDVAKVEQLCAKLNDMSSLTHRAIVSTSGYSQPSKKKAADKGVELYEFRRWTRPLQEQFPALAAQGDVEKYLRMNMSLLTWKDYQITLIVSDPFAEFRIGPTDLVFDATGELHRTYKNYWEYKEKLLLRSTEVLAGVEKSQMKLVIQEFDQTPALDQVTDSPELPYTDFLQVASDEVFIKVGARLLQILGVSITGKIYWRRDSSPAHYYVVEHVPTGDALAGAIVLPGAGEGQMYALVFSPESRDVRVELVQLERKHLNSIRKLKLNL